MKNNYTVSFKTMDGNYHKETVRAHSESEAREFFKSGQRGKLRLSRISYIVDISAN